jgi:hypothetical protein
MLVVLALFATAAVVVPTLLPIATTDDWAYARSAQILLAEGRLEIFPVVAATAVFQVIWGALFGLLFGSELGVFRLSTVVMTALGAVALYGLCRHLGATASRAALGAAAYLFNPLAFALAFSFMTDPHFASLLLIATLLYARGLDPGTSRHREIVAGSAVAGLALLTRQQGVLIPLAVASYLLLAGQLRFTRASLALLLRVGGVPAATAIGYYLWLRFVNDVPAVQASFLRAAVGTGWGGTAGLVWRLTWIEVVYVGFFALPVVAAALPSLRRLLAPPVPGGLLFIWRGTAWWSAGWQPPGRAGNGCPTSGSSSAGGGSGRRTCSAPDRRSWKSMQGMADRGLRRLGGRPRAGVRPAFGARAGADGRSKSRADGI